MIKINVSEGTFFRLASHLFLTISLVIGLCSAQPGFAASLKKNSQIPLILMGGHWTAHYKPENSDISRVCDMGFTHVFSYYNELGIKSEFTVETAISNAAEFSSTVKKNCPKLGIAMGIPRRWIYDGRLDLIKYYALELKAKNIAVDYWLADEIIHEMTSKGMTLKDAKRKVRGAINAVKEVSNAPYIWIEPGNYSPHFSAILDALNDLPAGIKSYDEYVISRTGRLAKSQAKFNSVLATLKRLKSKGNKVFPVCEINYDKKKNIAPSEEELAAISITLLMEGADGLVFWEERWTTPEILQSLKRISGLINFLNDVGISNFIRTKDAFTSWEAKSKGKIIKTVLNTTGSNIALTELLPSRGVVVWPSGGKIEALKPMELLVYLVEI